MLENKRRIGFGKRGWVLTIYMFLAFVVWCATQNSLNILSPLYAATRGWNATLITSVYTIGSLISIVFQFILNKYVATHSVKKASIIFGILSLVLAVFLSLAMQQAIFCVIYVCMKICQDMWALVANGMMAGQWFPRRKGTVMGIATFGFPLASGFGMAVIGMLVNKSTFMSFLPFLIMGVIAMILIFAFLSDYPEEVGAYRDNDKSMTPEEAKKMMLQEKEARKNTVWTFRHLLGTRDFWFLVIPCGLLLFSTIGVMIQITSLLQSVSPEFYAAYGVPTLTMISVAACLGSWLVGVLDTRFGTKTAIIIAGFAMLVSGISGAFGTLVSTLIAGGFLSIFMGAASNFTVSISAEYWNRSDFPTVYALVSPVVSLISAFGPMVIAIIGAIFGFRLSFILVAVLSVFTIVLPFFASGEHIAKKGEMYMAHKAQKQQMQS
jgi:MFS family permease